MSTLALPATNIALSGRLKVARRKLLDFVPGAWLAFSIYPLNSSYTGPLFNVRRSSDNATQDFYAVGDDFPYQAFADFVGSSTAFLTTAYDQTNTGQQNPTQTTAARQPVVAIGAGGKAEIQFTLSATQWLQLVLQIPQNLTWMQRLKSFSSTFNGVYSPGIDASQPQKTNNSFVNIYLNGGTVVATQGGDSNGATIGGPTLTAANVTAYNTYGGTIDDGAGIIRGVNNGSVAGSPSNYTAPRRTTPTAGPCVFNFGGANSGTVVGNLNMAITHFAAFSRVLSAAEIAMVDQLMQGTYAGAANFASTALAATVTASARLNQAASAKAPLTSTVRAGVRTLASVGASAALVAQVRSALRLAPAIRAATALAAMITARAVMTSVPTYAAGLAAQVRSALTGLFRFLYPAVPNMATTGRVKVAARPVVLRDFSTLENGTRSLNVIGLLDPGNDIDAEETITGMLSVSLSVIGPAGATDGDLAMRIDGVAGVEGAVISQRFGNWQRDTAKIQYMMTARFSTTRRDDVAVFGTFYVVRPGG